MMGNNGPDAVITPNGAKYLRTGVIDTDVASYPNAIATPGALQTAPSPLTSNSHTVNRNAIFYTMVVWDDVLITNNENSTIAGWGNDDYDRTYAFNVAPSHLESLSGAGAGQYKQWNDNALFYSPYTRANGDSAVLLPENPGTNNTGYVRFHAYPIPNNNHLSTGATSGLHRSTRDQSYASGIDVTSRNSAKAWINDAPTYSHYYQMKDSGALYVHTLYDHTVAFENQISSFWDGMNNSSTPSTGMVSYDKIGNCYMHVYNAYNSGDWALYKLQLPSNITTDSIKFVNMPGSDTPIISGNWQFTMADNSTSSPYRSTFYKTVSGVDYMLSTGGATGNGVGDFTIWAAGSFVGNSRERTPYAESDTVYYVRVL
jgi:hypothetical protein